MLALDAGQRIGECEGMRFVTFLEGFLLPLLHRAIIHEHNCKGYSEKPDDNQNADVVRIVESLALNLEELVLPHLKHLAVCRTVDVVMYLLYDGVFPVFAYPLR